MGLCPSITKRAGYGYEYEYDEKDGRMFIQKMRVLQQEINAVVKLREEEIAVFALKEAEWRRQRRRLREEVRQLRRSLVERDERIRLMEEEAVVVKGWKLLGHGQGEGRAGVAGSLVVVEEEMREETEWRDEAVVKWKMLYLAIKNELDDLIERTHQGKLYWRAEEEELMEEMQREMREKDETIEALRAQIGSMENEEYKRKREVDILRQSLKIISSKKGITSSSSTQVVVKSPFKALK